MAISRHPERCARASALPPKADIRGMQERVGLKKWTLALPEAVEHWSLTTLRNKLIKIGAKVVRHGHYITFQLAEVAVSRVSFAEILR